MKVEVICTPPSPTGRASPYWDHRAHRAVGTYPSVHNHNCFYPAPKERTGSCSISCDIGLITYLCNKYTDLSNFLHHVSGFHRWCCFHGPSETERAWLRCQLTATHSCPLSNRFHSRRRIRGTATTTGQGRSVITSHRPTEEFAVTDNTKAAH